MEDIAGLRICPIWPQILFPKERRDTRRLRRNVGRQVAKTSRKTGTINDRQTILRALGEMLEALAVTQKMQ